MDPFEQHMKLYRHEHRTLGCKITHMFGVPMIVASLPTVFFDWQVAVLLFVVGWILQFAGHFVFEKNRPLVMANPKNPMTYLAAVVFVAEEWSKLLTGKPLVDPA
jgi:uncharacterized membrane protein YGL010W